MYMIPYTKILPNLYVGNFSAGMRMIYDNRKPTHVISCIPIPQTLQKEYEKNNVWFVEQTCDDHPAVNIVQHFEQLSDVIQYILYSGGTLLVNCMAGRSRSVSIVILILIKFHNMSFTDAYRFVAQRREIGPNYGFISQLQSYAERF